MERALGDERFALVAPARTPPLPDQSAAPRYLPRSLSAARNAGHRQAPAPARRRAVGERFPTRLFGDFVARCEDAYGIPRLHAAAGFVAEPAGGARRRKFGPDAAGVGSRGQFSPERTR